MELIRNILLAVEDHDAGFVPNNLKIEGYDDDTVAYHCYLMGDAGLAEVVDTTHMQSPGPSATIGKLTWQGHEFLDAARDAETWEAAKEVAEGAGQNLRSMSISVVTALLISVIKEKMGLQ